MKKAFLLLFLIFSITLLTASEYSDEQLDIAIEEFNNKNYEQSLEIIDGVLEVEPENKIALMYKKTIEDIYKIEKEEAKEKEADIQEDKSSAVKVEDKRESFIFLETRVGSTDDNLVELSQSLRLDLGLPVIEASISSDLVSFDFANIFNDIFPFSELDILNSHKLDISVGVNISGLLGGNSYFDLIAGVSNYNYKGSEFTGAIPFIGFKSKIHPLSSFIDNSLTNSLWIGLKGRVYLYNDEIVDNYSLDLSAGVDIGNFNLGAFYNLVNIGSTDYKLNTYGLVLGFKL